MPHTAPAGQRSGTLISTPYEGGPVRHQDTISCVHCGYTSVWIAGQSDKWWSMCLRCMGLKCGRHTCLAKGCVPQDILLENLEQGRPEGYRPICVPVR